MRRLNITAKIWLSAGVFVLGFVISTVLSQVNGVRVEHTLETTSRALFPAAHSSQEADAAFQRMVKGFGDAVLTQDASAVDRASQDGRSAVETLRAAAALPGLSPERAGGAAKIGGSVQQLLNDARATYGAVLANPANMNAENQEKMRALASRTEVLRNSLAALERQCSDDLKQRLAALGASSAHDRWFGLGVFVATLLLASVIVNLTIRRAITGPVQRVIEGVHRTANEATDTSEQMAKSGQTVARDAQEQAACIEETSASLEQISATTRQNATQAKEADQLMRNASETVDRAGRAMNSLKDSMDAISKSSNQVAAVLKSIDEIAFHTNILALNAAVEAARAGEAGAGFSVVADEVRSLAQRAAEAARNSADIVQKTIQDVTQGVQFVATAHDAFQEVSTAIAGGGAVVSRIASTSEEQARGITHIGEAISRIEAVTQNNSATAQHTADAASAMLSQVQATRESLRELMAVVGVEIRTS